MCGNSQVSRSWDFIVEVGQNSYFWSMNRKEKFTIGLIKSKIKEKDSRAEVILFGSHARGEARMDSDWDILILLDSLHVTRNIEKEYREELFDVELETGEPISTFVYSKYEWESKHSVTPLYHSIKRDGIILQWREQKKIEVKVINEKLKDLIYT